MAAPPGECPNCGSPLGEQAGQLCRPCVLRRLFESEEVGDTNAVEENRFGDYVIENEIARGGMGIVYRAQEADLKRVVALKVLNPEGLAGSTNEARFQDEVTAIAALDHPNIVPVYDHGRIDERSFYTMKFVEGGPLSEQAAPPKAARLIARTARAVHHAHERGILHRDIKPSNILVDEKGEPQVIDFGLARRLDLDSDLTVSGAVLGTPAFMPPEQAAGKSRSLTTAADVYGLGAVLYFLLVGRPPFGGSQLDILRQVTEVDPTAPSTIIRRLDRDLSVICMKCLEKSPNDRYRSALELAEDLERWIRQEPIRARPAGFFERTWKWARRRPAVAALLAVTLISLLTITVLSVLGQREATRWANEKKAESDKALAAKAETDLKAADLTRSLIRNEFLRAEGHFERNETARGLATLARVLRRDLSFQPAIMRLKSALDRRVLAEPLFPPLKHNDVVTQTVFSHDDRRLATATRDGLVQIWDAETGEPLLPPMNHDDLIVNLIWSPNDRLLLSAGTQGPVKIWRTDTGEPARPEIGPGDFMLKFNDDGVLYGVGKRPGKLLRWDPRTDESSVQDIAGVKNTVHASLSADGSSVLVTAMDGYTVLHDTRTGRSRPTKIPHDPTPAPVNFRVALNRAGTLGLQYGGNVSRVPLHSLATGETKYRWFHDRPVRVAGFSPDESLVMTGSDDGAVRLFEAETGLLYRRKFQHQAPVTHAEFTRDGNFLAVATADDTVSLWDVHNGQMVFGGIRQSGRIRCIHVNRRGDRLVSAAEDGTAVVWDIGRKRTLPGLTLPRPSEHSLRNIAFAADDRRLFVGSRGGRSAVYDTQTGRAIGPGLPHSDTVVDPQITPDGKTVAAAIIRGRLEVLDIESGSITTPIIEVSPAVTQVAMAPNGRRVACVCRWHGFVEQRDLSTGKRILPRFYHGQDFPVTAAYSPDGSLVVVGSVDRTIRVWDSQTGEMAWRSEPLESVVNDVAFSRNGKRLLVRTRSETITLWDAGREPRMTHRLEHSSQVSCGAISPDASRIITGTAEGIVKVWDAKTGQSVGRTFAHGSAVVEAQLSPDNNTAISIAANGEAKLWDVETGFAILEPIRFSSAGLGVRVSDNGELIAAAAVENPVTLLPLPERPPIGPAPNWLADLAENYAGIWLDEFDQITHLSSDERTSRLREISKARGEDRYSRWLKAWFKRPQGGERP